MKSMNILQVKVVFLNHGKVKKSIWIIKSLRMKVFDENMIVTGNEEPSLVQDFY